MKRTALLLLCLFVLAPFQLSFAKTSPDNTDSPQPLAFSTPEQTWNQFKGAILEGDFDTAKKCCCQDKIKGVSRFEKMDTKKRKNIIQSMQELTKIHQQENKAKYKLLRNSNGAAFSTYVYFEKIDNDWKIENY